MALRGLGLPYPRGRFLTVDAFHDRSGDRPGSLRVTVRTRLDGAPVPAEVELGIVDESLHLPDRTVELPRFFYYSWQPWYASRSTYSSQGELFRAPSGSGFVCGWGALNVNPALRAMLGYTDLTEGPRRPLPAPLLWAGQLRTGADGKAEVQFPAPKGPARLRVLARAVSGPDRFGETRSTIEVR